MSQGKSKPRGIRVPVPEDLAKEIRRIARVSRRSIQAVANVALGDVFETLEPKDIRSRWLDYVSRELGQEVIKDGDGL